MRILVIGFGIAALAWSGYWLIGSRQASQSARSWFADRAAEGWTADYSEVRTRGFPNRFDTTITAPDLALPGGALGGSAPFVQIFRLSYKPEHAIVIFPDRMSISVAGQAIAVTADRLRASTVFETSDIASLDRANLEGEELALKPAAFGEIAIGQLLAAIRNAAVLPLAHDVAVDMRDIALSGGSGTSTIRLEALSLDATATLDAPIGVGEIGAGRIGVDQLDLRRFHAVSDAFDLVATGAVTLDSGGLPSGRFDLQIRDWEALLRQSGDIGLLSQATHAKIAARLLRIAEETGGANPVEVRLDIRRGTVLIGSEEMR